MTTVERVLRRSSESAMPPTKNDTDGSQLRKVLQKILRAISRKAKALDLPPSCSRMPPSDRMRESPPITQTGQAGLVLVEVIQPLAVDLVNVPIRLP
jgi:hypothetical protein